MLGSARLGAVLAGVPLPFWYVMHGQDGPAGSVVDSAAAVLGLLPWVSATLFVLCVIAQTLEYRLGRRDRNRIMARWPSLWHSKRGIAV